MGQNGQRRFLACFAECGSIRMAARWAGCSREMHRKWLKEDALYRDKFREAEAHAGRTLEDEAVERAVHGIRQPVLYKGKQVYVQGLPVFERIVSDGLLTLLLKANNPDKFKDRSVVETAWDGDVTKLRPEQLAKLEEQLTAIALQALTPEQLAESKRVALLGEGGQTIDVESVKEVESDGSNGIDPEGA